MARDEIERGAAALFPFVQEWKLSLNPEDLDEIVYAVLVHAQSNRSFEEIDAAVRQQLADYGFAQARFQKEAYGGMSAEEAAVRGVIDLLVRGDFETALRATRNSRVSADELRRAVAEYGRTLATPEASWWSKVHVTPIESVEGSLYVAAPMWTEEEGRSDLTLELRLTPIAPSAYEVAVEDLHVL